jgi:hypothetical protein
MIKGSFPAFSAIASLVATALAAPQLNQHKILFAIFFHQSLNCYVKGIHLVHLLDRPHPALPVKAVKRPLVAVFAQGNANILPVLFDVVCVAWASLIAYRAGERLHPPDVSAFSLCQLVVHAWPLV